MCIYKYINTYMCMYVHVTVYVVVFSCRALASVPLNQSIELEGQGSWQMLMRHFLNHPILGSPFFEQYPNENCSWKWKKGDFSNFLKTNEFALIGELGTRLCETGKR